MCSRRFVFGYCRNVLFGRRGLLSAAGNTAAGNAAAHAAGSTTAAGNAVARAAGNAAGSTTGHELPKGFPPFGRTASGLEAQSAAARLLWHNEIGDSGDNRCKGHMAFKWAPIKCCLFAYVQDPIDNEVDLIKDSIQAVFGKQRFGKQRFAFGFCCVVLGIPMPKLRGATAAVQQLAKLPLSGRRRIPTTVGADLPVHRRARSCGGSLRCAVHRGMVVCWQLLRAALSPPPRVVSPFSRTASRGHTQRGRQMKSPMVAVSGCTGCHRVRGVWRPPEKSQT